MLGNPKIAIYGERTRFQEGHIGYKSTLGTHRSNETKRKININHNSKSGFINKHHSEETKQKLREAFLGEKSFFWKGGISFISYPQEFNEIKEQIRIRDNHICRFCDKVQTKQKFSIHHIDYNKKNNNPDNLITLCRSCHGKTNINREWWLNASIKVCGKDTTI